MDSKSLKIFLGHRVKLVKKNGFILNGIINAIYEDSIEFRTNQATALISLEFVKEIVLTNRGEGVND